jgi:hypothetical protein
VARLGSQLKRQVAKTAAARPQAASASRSLTEIALMNDVWTDASCRPAARCSTGNSEPTEDGFRVELRLRRSFG